MSLAENGIGLSKEEQEKIFDLFYRAGKARARKVGGHGLSIAKAIVDAHKGEIKAESNLNQGTIFFIGLPVFELDGKAN
ncbi:ATP-binding protein [Planomicrobium sp. CPCC 101079]|uniref:ATP-binding protein n=1 Tax=Planomicrobium sp. CPCC 101079 TaxID=2599618 RepID=UPI0011B65FE2|nr:ATP-binding protein [Planomicrobium sp. CPCC 101079]TWT01119.1 cell wall metabolism sensor histidine kinase WalK [Planomicrobium sp. CPCC 101079]